MTTLVLNVGLALVWLSGALVGAAVVLGAQRERAPLRESDHDF